MNTVSIVGHLVADPKVKALPSGTEVCELTVAVNERSKEREYASFLDVDCYGSLATVCGQYLAKGRQVAVTGRLRQERWENEAGQKRSRVKIVASGVDFIGPKTEAKAPAPDWTGDEARAFVAGPGNGPGARVDSDNQTEDDDIPF